MAERRFIVAPRGGGKTASVLIEAQAEITRLTADNAELRELYNTALRDVVDECKKNAALREAAVAYRELVVCYRINQAPSEELFVRLDGANAAIDAKQWQEPLIKEEE